MLRIKEYVKVTSVDEAYELLQKGRQNRIVGGMLWLRLKDVSISTAIDLSECGLNQVEDGEEEVKIGAMVTLRELETNPLIQSLYEGIISDSVRDIVGVQFRNLATIGGSIYSRFGFSDILTALLCLPTDVVLHHGGRISLKEYVNMPYERDVLTHIIIKKGTGKAHYLSERRSATDFPVLAAAVSYIDGNWNIAIGARPMKAQLLSVKLPVEVSEEDVKIVQEQVLNEMKFDSNMRGSREYRMLLAETLVARGMKAVREGKQMTITVTINGKSYTDEVKADLRLMDYLRDKGFYSVKCGCETSNCGLCTVWMDDKPVLSCSILAARADGHNITTLEGLEKEAHEFAVFMANEGAEQCGYCSPGFVMNVLAMKKELKNPSEDEIKHYLAGNLCRCTGYMGQMRAITKYLKEAERI